MIFRKILLYVAFASLLSGCVGSELPFNDNSKDPELFARTIK